MPVEDVTFCVTPIPGPPGSDGADGADGTNGVNAYTTTSAQFTMPAEAANVTVSVVTSAPFGVGQILWIESGGAKGYFEVVSKPSSTSLSLKNLEVTASSAYTINSAPGTVFATGGTVSPAGIQGPAGTAAAGVLLSTNNLSDVAAPATARTNLGLGSLATASSVNNANWSGTDLAIANGGTGGSTAADARTNLGLAIGSNVQAYDAFLDSIAAIGTGADKYIYTTGVSTAAEGDITAFARTLLDDADAATARATLGISGTFDMLYYRQAVSSGTAGAAFTAAGWNTVPINTEVVDTGNNGSLAANEITLAAGTYRYRYGVVGAAVNRFQARIYNVTDAGVLTDSYSSVVYADSGTTSANTALGNGRFTIASSKAIRLEAYCGTTGTFGAAGSFGGGEVYSWIELEKE